MMTQQHNPILAKLAPFLGAGIFLVIIVVAIIVFSYVLLIGGAIGLILFCLAYLKRKFFPSKKQDVALSKNHASHTYDNDEFK